MLRVDGGNALGQVASYHAIEAAFPVARETGIVGVAVRNSNHFGTAAYYCQMACREGMALIATTNSRRESLRGAARKHTLAPTP